MSSIPLDPHGHAPAADHGHGMSVGQFISTYVFSLDHKIDRLRPGGNPVTVGRGRDNDIIIDDRSVSKFHSTIALTQDGKLIVADVGSSNGTFVNDKAIKGRMVVDLGDVITFGDIEVRLEV